MVEQDETDYGQPVDEGDELVVTIEDIGSKGDGIARIDGFVVFVPDIEVGETVRIEVDTIGRKFAFATVLDRDVEGEQQHEREETDGDGSDEMQGRDEGYDKDETEEDEGYEKEEVDDEPLNDAQEPEDEL